MYDQIGKIAVPIEGDKNSWTYISKVVLNDMKNMSFEDFCDNVLKNQKELLKVQQQLNLSDAQERIRR